MLAVHNDAIHSKGLDLLSDRGSVVHEVGVGIVLFVQRCKNKIEATVDTIGVFFG